MARIWFVREKPDKITAWRQGDSSWSLSRWWWWCSPWPWGHHLPPWSLEAVLEAFFDRDLACTLACLFFSSDLANFLPQESHVNGFSPAKSGDKWKLSYIGIVGKTVNWVIWTVRWNTNNIYPRLEKLFWNFWRRSVSSVNWKRFLTPAFSYFTKRTNVLSKECHL